MNQSLPIVHHQLRYFNALKTSVFDYIRTMAEGPIALEFPELSFKFQVVLWIAYERAKPRSFSIPELAGAFGISREGMRKQLLNNPMVLVRAKTSRTQGHTIFLQPWLLEIALQEAA